MDFIAVDVETANSQRWSICQLGICVVEAGKVVKTDSVLIDPECEFDPFNVEIHGIDAKDVKGKGNFRSSFLGMSSDFHGSIVLSHTSFDSVAIHQACERYEIEVPVSTWIDTARVSRRAWPKGINGFTGWSLKKLCRELDIDFKHHDAGEDARACAELMLRAIDVSGIDLESWPTRNRQPIDPTKKKSTSRQSLEGNPEGPLCGEVVVFTGTLSLPRGEYAKWAAELGCDVGAGVNKKTSILVVGDQDLQRLGGKDKSNKHRKAEEAIKKGQDIQILGESELRCFLDQARNS